MTDDAPNAQRREFLRLSALAAAATALPSCVAPAARGSRLRFGLVTYLWGRNWDLPTLIDNCERSGVLGVELRTEHAHGVEPSIDAAARRQVRARFADSPVTLVGSGTNAAFHHREPELLARDIATAQAFLQLSHDVGGSGVKVKPDALPAGVPIERTIEQIGRSLRQLAIFADDLGQEVRLEVHGAQTSRLAHIRSIMQVADHRRAVVCWNSNPEDLIDGGLAHNFGLVRQWFGATAHVRELDDVVYPYAELMRLFVAADYGGWILLEARRDPPEPIAALRRQKSLWRDMVAAAQ